MIFKENENKILQSIGKIFCNRSQCVKSLTAMIVVNVLPFGFCLAPWSSSLCYVMYLDRMCSNDGFKRTLHCREQQDTNPCGLPLTMEPRLKFEWCLPMSKTLYGISELARYQARGRRQRYILFDFLCPSIIWVDDSAAADVIQNNLPNVVNRKGFMIQHTAHHNFLFHHMGCQTVAQIRTHTGLQS